MKNKLKLAFVIMASLVLVFTKPKELKASSEEFYPFCWSAWQNCILGAGLLDFNATYQFNQVYLYTTTGVRMKVYAMECVRTEMGGPFLPQVVFNGYCMEYAPIKI